jgi:hypothetical protein
MIDPWSAETDATGDGNIARLLYEYRVTLTEILFPKWDVENAENEVFFFVSDLY